MLSVTARDRSEKDKERKILPSAEEYAKMRIMLP